jgi:hypothetical protein
MELTGKFAIVVTREPVVFAELPDDCRYALPDGTMIVGN